MHTKHEVLDWLRSHPNAVHGDPLDVVTRCEIEVRRHAAADAWRSAAHYLEGRRDLWERRGGNPITSSAFVARELCRLFAHELHALHPRVTEGNESEFAGEKIIAQLDPAAWQEIREWVRDLALQEEQKTWDEVVKFTRGRAQSLPEQRETSEPDCDTPDGTYGHAAAVIAGQLMDQYEEMAELAEH